MARENFEKLPNELLECIINNNVPKVRFLMSKFQLKNVTSIKHIQADNPTLKMRGRDFDLISNSTARRSAIEPMTLQASSPEYDTSNWSPVLFAIYYQRTDIAKLMLESYTTNFIMAIRQPPFSEFTEYIIPGPRQAEPRLKFQDESFASQVRPSEASL